jgi:hypothetical protein
MAVGFPKTSNMYNDEFLKTLQEVSPPDMTGDFSFDFGDRLPPGFRPGPGFTPPPGFRPIPGFRPTPGYMPPGYTDPNQGPTLGPDEFGSYTIPFSDPTYSSGFNYARSIAGGIPMSQVIAPGVSYSPDQPMGYTQEQLNTPIGTTPTTPPPTPPTTPPPPDDPGFFGGIGGVTIPMPPPPPGFFNIFGGTPPSGAGGSGLPEGYSYDMPMDGTYTSVMPSPGMRYAYGPDGDRIEVPDNRSTGGTPPVSTGPLGDLLTSLLGGMGAGTGGTRGPSDAQVGDGMPKPPIDVGGPVPIRGPQPVLVGGPAYGGIKDATPIKQPFGGGQPPVDDDFISGPRPLPGFDVSPIPVNPIDVGGPVELPGGQPPLLVGGPPPLPGGGTTVLPEPQPVSGLPVGTIDFGGISGITSNPMGITPIAPPMGGMGLPSLPQEPVIPNLGPQGPSGGRFSINQLLGLI